MIARLATCLVALFLGLAPLAAGAQGDKAAPLSSGEVTKVDREARKVTIKHGPIDNLRMPPMTMVFRVKEAAMLDGLSPGAKIRFRAVEAEGGYIVTRLQAAR
jgi:Cu(I)/Ag(I) efflux system periplasmic protein CusF